MHGYWRCYDGSAYLVADMSFISLDNDRRSLNGLTWMDRRLCGLPHKDLDGPRRLVATRAAAPKVGRSIQLQI